MSTAQEKSATIDGADNSSNLLPLKKKVAAMVKQLEDLNEKFTNETLREFDGAALSVRLDYVENVNKTFEMAQSVLEEGESTDSSSRMNFTSLYFDVKAKLARQIEANRAVGSNQRSSTLRQFSQIEAPFSSISMLHRTKVPEIQLPKFRGSYSEWPNFFGLFSAVIHNNSELSELEKFHYLRSSLSEAALDTVASLELSDANYEEALSLLRNRFDNKLLNFQSHIKEIFALDTVENASAVSLRRLSDKINSHLRALQAIGTKEEIADGLLIFLVSSKLDEKSQSKWEENLPINEIPAWNSMATFLERRCRMLENLENSMVPKLQNQQISTNAKHSNRHVHVSSLASPIFCTFCDSKEHFITSCSRFTNLSPSLRFKEAKRIRLCLNCLKKGHMVKSCTSGDCRKCSSRHHTLLHIENEASSDPVEEAVPPSASQAVLVSSSLAPESCKPSNVNVLLATAIILVKNRSGVFVPCRAILDSASQLHLISSSLVNSLQLRCDSACVTISGIGDGNLAIKKSVDICAKSWQGDYSTSFSAMVVPSITDYQPCINISTVDWNIPGNIKLADPSFDKCGRIDILIGAELFFELMSVGQIKFADNLPILQKTLLGWVVAGGGFSSSHSWSLVVSSKNEGEEEDQLSSIMKTFWEVENDLECNTSLSDEDVACERHFSKNVVRLDSGAYSVRLPQVEGRGIHSLGESYERALQRFKGLERKFRRYPKIKTQYAAFMSEYANLNHMSPISSQETPKKYFLPHHCVHKQDSTTTKLRVVFDGSAKTTSGLSLNDTLYAGPTIQPKLFNTLLRYRFFEVALSGDICKMYRCVRVSHPDDFLQCILWRENVSDDIKVYKLNTVTYGTKPAAFLAIRAMHQLASDEESTFPLGAKVVRRDFYVDDMLSGGASVEEVLEIREQVSALLKKGDFIIRKWCSNVPDVLRDLPSDQCEQMVKFHDGTNVTKTLGLVWDPNSDNFMFSFSPIEPGRVVTKRSVLSSIGRLYDPLGLIGPVITKAKIFMQHLWKLQLLWDESLQQSLHTSWLEYTSTFSAVHNFAFPRFASMSKSNVQIHAFCDASLAAYGACIYVRSDLDGVVKTALLCSKSRVSPLKTLTVPKLELAAAALLAELVDVIVKSLPFSCKVHCWSDSMVVLSWLQEQPSNFNVFVSNRVSRIQSLTSQMSWHYIPTELNPADILSRGATPEELLHFTLWRCGPSFLSYESSRWPDNVEFLAELPERRRNILLAGSLSDLSIQCKYHNSFTKMQRIFAYIFKFLHPKSSGPTEVLTPMDVKNGTHLLIKNIQLVHFAIEHKALTANQSISSSSKLYSLMPLVDSFGLIRVGGRLQHSNLDYDARHPIILPKGHPITISMVMHLHQKLLHAGPQSLLASIRQQYWPIGGRKLISSLISRCLRCFKMKPKLNQHIMGCLPSDRVTPNRAFHTTGVDFCGPFYYKSEVKSRPPVKCFVSIFICFSTKATHLEVVQDLSTTSFLCALRRFVATRGKPKTIWSDNATNFVGAKNELAELKHLFLSQSHLKEVHQLCLNDGIEWKFIPLRSPHFGGLWEAAVKSAKFHFYRTVGLNILTCDELRTLVCQISAILNSRPLCPISENPDDLDVLTPGHFLVGGPLTSIIEPDMSWINYGNLNSWQKVSEMQQTFWRKWSSSYLSLLQERCKWREQVDNITRDTMVILKDENVPPLKWQMGRVVDVICGDDGVARVVTVRTANGVFRRAVSKLAALPIDVAVEDLNPSTGGECRLYFNKEAKLYSNN